MPANNIYIPFTYLIGWSTLGKFYYGVKFAKNCHPEELWKTYFTSSKVVLHYRLTYGEPDVIQIRKIFDNKKDAILWEQRVLIKLNVRENQSFLNAACIKEHWCLNGGVPSNKGKPMSKEQKLKISETRKKKGLGKKNAKYLRKMVGDDNPMRREEVRKAYANKITGRRKKYNDDGSWSWHYPDK